MSRYEYFEHTADIGIRGYGKTYHEALESVSKGMFAQICDTSEMQESLVHQIEISAQSPEELAIRFLNKLILIFETEHFVPIKYKLIKLKGNALEAFLWGDTLDSEKHKVYSEVKAATYHNLEITHKKDWMIQVVVDV